MDSRERTLTALRHQEPDRVPVCLAYETPCGIAERYRQAYDETLMRQDVYMVSLPLGPPRPGIRSRYLQGVPEDAVIDSWGVATWRSSTGDSHAVHGPLRNMTRPEELDDFPFPEVRGGDRFRELSENVADFHRRGLAVQGALSQTVFELAWNTSSVPRTVSTVMCPGRISSHSTRRCRSTARTERNAFPVSVSRRHLLPRTLCSVQAGR